MQYVGFSFSAMGSPLRLIANADLAAKAGPSHRRAQLVLDEMVKLGAGTAQALRDGVTQRGSSFRVDLRLGFLCGHPTDQEQSRNAASRESSKRRSATVVSGELGRDTTDFASARYSPQMGPLSMPGGAIGTVSRSRSRCVMAGFCVAITRRPRRLRLRPLRRHPRRASQ